MAHVTTTLRPRGGSTARLSPPIALLLTCCLLPPLSAQTPKPASIPLSNPGFEEGKRGWDPACFKQFQDLLDIDNQTSRSENVSLRITSRRGTENPWLSQSVPNLRGGATYLLRAWVKGDGTTVPSLAALKIEYYNVAQKMTLARSVRQQPPAAGQWQDMQVIARAPPDTVTGRIVVGLFGHGTIWVDDVQLTMSEPPPPLALTPQRQAVRAGKRRTIPFLVHLADAWEQDDPPSLSFTVIVPPRQLPYEPEVRIRRHDSRTFGISLEMPQMVVGAYQINCTMAGIEASDIAHVFVPVEKRKPSSLTDDGVILAGGKPFFPIGLYHVGPADYSRIAKAGFNCVQGLGTLDVPAFASSLNAARDARLMVDVPLYAFARVKENLPTSLKKLIRHRRRQSVLSWKIADEPERRPGIIDEVPAAYQALRATDPDHPLLLTISVPEQYDYWANFCDIMQVRPSPIPPAPLTTVSEMVSSARKVLKPWQNLTVVLQAGWQRDPLNQPTFAQARVMLYLALTNGAKGVFWYAYRDPGWWLEETPLWDRFADINKETATLANPLMLGTEPPDLHVEFASDELQWLARDFGGKTYVLLVNPGLNPVTVTISPQKAIGSAPCLHGGLAKIEDRKVVVELSPLGADTVILGPGASAPTETPEDPQPEATND